MIFSILFICDKLKILNIPLINKIIELYKGEIILDISQIKTFINLVELKSYSKTAMKMYISQPAVSLRIKALEKELGYELIKLEKKRLRVTLTGEYFYQKMLNIINSFDETVNTIQREFSSDAEYTIGVTPFCAKYILPDILSEISKHPEYKLTSIRTVPQSLQLIDLYTKGVVDSFILSANDLPTDPGYKMLWEEPIILVCSTNHPLAQLDRKAKLEDIKDWPLALLSTDRDNKYFYNYDFIKMCEDQKIDLNIKLIIDNIELAKELIEIDNFISFLPLNSVRDELHNSKLKEIPVKIPIKLSFKLFFYSNHSDDKLFQDLYYMLRKIKLEK